MPEPSGDQYGFEWSKIAHLAWFSPDMLEATALPPGVANVNVAVDRSSSFLSDMLVAKIRAYVLTHQLAEHSVSRQRIVSWPASPWQHFKQRHAESWWLRWLAARRPVRMQHEVVDFQEAWTELAAYPWQTHLPPFPELGRPNRVVLSDVRWTPESADADPQVSADDAPWLRRPEAGSDA